MLLTLAAGGCSMSEKRVVPPAQIRPVMDATRADLIAAYQREALGIRTINATVRMSPVAGSAYSGVIQQYHDVGGFILAEKPALIRVIGQAPVVATDIFDMVSDSETFRIFIPSKNQFLVGSTKLERSANNPIENLRPQHILDALFWPELQEGAPVLFEQYDAPPARFYILTLTRGTDGAMEIDRKIWFDRSDLHVSRLEIFGPGGRLDSDIDYSDWQPPDPASGPATTPAPSGSGATLLFPRTIRLTRPQQDYALTIAILKLALNTPIPADRFTLNQPAGTELVTLRGDEPGAQP